ncbi:hypothetical protein FB451DRAFT_1185152 [Mycena latifolia]|nr:hypothetical protein FB451DRAFT_1185152 [Mycena latifolia]
MHRRLPVAAAAAAAFALLVPVHSPLDDYEAGSTPDLIQPCIIRVTPGATIKAPRALIALVSRHPAKQLTKVVWTDKGFVGLPQADRAPLYLPKAVLSGADYIIGNGSTSKKHSALIPPSVQLSAIRTCFTKSGGCHIAATGLRLATGGC